MKENRLPYGKNSGYWVPEGYFDGLEARMFTKLTEVPPQALSGKAEVPFRVPEAYFERLEEKLMAKVNDQKKPSKLISLLQRESFYYAAGVAAVFVAVVLSFPFAQPKPLTFEDLDMVSIESYLQESAGDPSAEVSRLYYEGLYSFAPIGRTELDQEAVMEYLQETLEDPSVIINED